PPLAVGVGASIPAGLLLANALHIGHVELLVVLLAGSSAAVAFPTIQERELTGPGVPLLMAWITPAHGVTALLMPPTLTGPARIPGALAGNLLIVMVCAATMAVGGRLVGRPAIAEAVRESKPRGGALPL